MTVDRKEIAIGTVVISLAALGLLVVPLYADDEFRQRLLAAVGHPFGISPELYVLLATVAVWLPLPIWFWHFLVVKHAAAAERSRLRLDENPLAVGLWMALQRWAFLVKLRGQSRSLLRAKLVTLGGFVYLVGLVRWWIEWTSSRGI